MRQTATMDSATPASAYRWVVIITWMGAHMWGIILIETLGIFLPSMREDMGLSPIQEGWLGSAPKVGILLIAIPSGWLFSRFRPKPLTTVTLLAGTLIMLFQAAAPFFGLLLLARLIYGLTVVSREPARALLIKQWMKPKEIMLANASLHILFGIGAGLFILMPLILGLLDDSWRATFYLLAVICFVLTLLWVAIGRERVTEEYTSELDSQQGSSPISSILKYKELWLVGLGVVGIEMRFSAFSTFWPSYMLDTYDISLTASAALFALSTAASAPCAVALGFLVARIGQRKLILAVSGLAVAGTALGLVYTGNFSLLILMSIGQGLSFAFFPIVLSVPFELSGIKPRETAVALAFLRTTMTAGGVIGPVLSGSIQSATDDLRLALTVTCLSALSLTVCALMLPGRWNRVGLGHRAIGKPAS